MRSVSFLFMALSLLLLIFLLPPHASSVHALSKFDDNERQSVIRLFPEFSSAERDDEESSSSSSSSDSKSISSSSEEFQEEGDISDEEGDFVENVADWRPSQSQSGEKCPKGKFLEEKTADCRPCTECGVGQYEREQCRSDKDTVCDPCFHARALLNRNFVVKCQKLVALRNEFRAAMAQRSAIEGQPKPTLFMVSMESISRWWKAELFVEMAFYLALIALVLAVIRFLVKSRSTSYRTVTVTPPALEEWEQKNIVRAAASIHEKLGKEGYAKLEEEFI